jgi:hypothetical protein
MGANQRRHTGNAPSAARLRLDDAKDTLEDVKRKIVLLQEKIKSKL